MVYKRRATKKSYKKRTYAKKPASSLAMQVAKSVGSFGFKLLKNRLGLNTESKWLDTTQSGTTSGTMTALTYPLTIPEGDGANSRNGDGVRLSRMRARYLIQADSTATLPWLVRLVYVHQPQVNQSAFAAADIFQVPTNILTPYNMDTVGYKILYDKTISVGPPTGDKPQHVLELDYRPLEHHVKWITSDTTGIATNLSEGRILAFIMTSGTANFPTFSSYTRVNFIDN